MGGSLTKSEKDELAMLRGLRTPDIVRYDPDRLLDLENQYQYFLGLEVAGTIGAVEQHLLNILRGIRTPGVGFEAEQINLRFLLLVDEEKNGRLRDDDARQLAIIRGVQVIDYDFPETYPLTQIEILRLRYFELLSLGEELTAEGLEEIERIKKCFQMQKIQKFLHYLHDIKDQKIFSKEIVDFLLEQCRKLISMHRDMIAMYESYYHHGINMFTGLAFATENEKSATEKNIIGLRKNLEFLGYSDTPSFPPEHNLQPLVLNANDFEHVFIPPKLDLPEDIDKDESNFFGYCLPDTQPYFPNREELLKFLHEGTYSVRE
jgi:hypothetical protein